MRYGITFVVFCFFFFKKNLWKDFWEGYLCGDGQNMFWETGKHTMVDGRVTLLPETEVKAWGGI